MPIVTSMLPKLPKEKPSLNKNQSSCEIIMKISEPSVFSRVSTAPSPMEIYERKHNLWNEMNEHESGEGVDAEQNINENRAYSSSLDKD
ncbi:Hypothetical protein CINCED_3A022003 [Cinara cedri]|uniref:Uncharacterized protein n=1 Tax=Cinara cedri TaxID=506608 RepID=A0A5E4LZM7_9HEMI|nr:Hypothetical protein CINCED_3A022003 [Cinara cedri]